MWRPDARAKMSDATRFLHYPGDVSHHGWQIVGPDLFGGMWQSIAREYDPETDTTRVGFMPYAAGDRS